MCDQDDLFIKFKRNLKRITTMRLRKYTNQTKPGTKDIKHGIYFELYLCAFVQEDRIFCSLD